MDCQELRRPMLFFVPSLDPVQMHRTFSSDCRPFAPWGRYCCCLSSVVCWLKSHWARPKCCRWCWADGWRLATCFYLSWCSHSTHPSTFFFGGQTSKRLLPKVNHFLHSSLRRCGTWWWMRKRATFCYLVGQSPCAWSLSLGLPCRHGSGLPDWPTLYEPLRLFATY